jgi:hypothetical protein
MANIDIIIAELRVRRKAALEHLAKTDAFTLSREMARAHVGTINSIIAWFEKTFGVKI